MLISKFKFSYYTIITDILDKTAERPKRILFTTKTGASVILEDVVIQQLQKNIFDDIPINVLSPLLEMEAIIPATENELDVLLHNNQAAIGDNKNLSIVVQPGASCQLGCGYCGQKHTKTYMDMDTQSKMVEHVEQKIKNNPYKSLDITWYGGEPLMALKHIRNISQQLISLAEKNKLRYGASMITNGLSLKEDIFVELVEKYKVTSFQITLDGKAEYHDTRRHTKENNPTFDIIFNNILNIVHLPQYKDLGARINIRCNIDKNNVDGLFPLITLLAEHKLQDKVGFYVAPIHNWGDNNAEKERGIAKNDLAIQEIDWMMELLKLGFSVNILPARKKIICMVVNKDSEVYDAFGNVSTCWEIPYTPVFEDTEYYIGNLKSGTIETDDAKIPMRNWNMDIAKGETWCATCKILPVCGGACPKHWLAGTPACPTYKFNIEDRLVLQYINKNKSLKELAM